MQLYNKPFALASSLYEGLRLTGGSAFGLKLHRFFPGVSTTADTWLAYKPSLFALMVDVCNRKAYRHYKREKKNLGLLRSSLLSLTEQLRPLLKKKGIKFSVPWYSTRRSPSLDLFGEKKIALAPYKGILRRAFNPRCLRPFNSGIPYSQRYLCPKILPKAVNFYDSLDHLRGGPSLAIKVRRLPKAREALLGRWSRAPSKFSFPLRFNLRNRKALFARAQRPFVIITQKLLRFLLFLFWQHRTQPSLSPLRVYYRLRRGRFAHLRKSFFTKRKRVLFLKRPTGLSPSHRRKFFVFTFGALFNSNPLRRRGTSRRREKLSKPLLENLKKQRFFFKGYSHCYFFNTSLDPFFLKSTCAYSARFFVLHWAFKSVLNISGVVTSKGAAFGLALKVYFLFAFSRISFLARRLVACLFSFLKFFPNNVSLDKDFARQRFFQKGFSFHFFLALRFFLLRQAMKSRFIKRLRLEKAKLPAQRGLLLSRRLPQGGAFKKSFPRGGSSNLVLSRGKKGFSQRSLPHKDLARGVGFKPIDKIFFARKPSASFVGLRPQKGLSLKKAHFVTSRKALVLARVARARFFYEKRQRLASRGLSKAVLKNTGKGPRVGSKITKNNGTFII